jgi:hypothetical protein
MPHTLPGAGLTLTAYCGERILCAATDQHTDRLLFYKEPPPEAVGKLRSIVGGTPIQKLIFMAPQPRWGVWGGRGGGAGLQDRGC